MAKVFGDFANQMAVRNSGSGGNNYQGGTTGSSQGGQNVQNVINEGGINRGAMSVEQATRWNAVQDAGGAAQFEGKANSYAWMLLNKAVDNAIKALG